ncbi:Ribosome-binding ATPase YchF [Chlamydiales bacterium SCGC AB-751-O23]|jgi:ribosome-binding ATPase|nr:Ribosome-binding ATPase YchF [Chlamydiales bacterium SCGC AB-751-O23]
MANVSVGIVGLPNVGKSTLFTALTKTQAEAANYPFCTIDPNIGVVELKDPRLQELSTLSKSKKIIYSAAEFVDIAGLVKGAASGEGLGNKFLANIRETDAIAHVVRCFVDDDITHVAGVVDPIADIEVIDIELILSDLQNIENILLKLEKRAKSQKDLKAACETLSKVKEHLNKNLPIRSLEFSEEEIEHLVPYKFLTSKKVIYVANIGEAEIEAGTNEYVEKVRELAAKQNCPVVVMCAQIEAEIAAMGEEEEKEFFKEMGLKESGLNQLVKRSFEALDLITFITTGQIETRAWTVGKDALAPEAAGKIHTDIQQGFIRAEVIAYNDFIQTGGRNQAREAGKMRAEGKEYEVQDGDVILFLHN